MNPLAREGLKPQIPFGNDNKNRYTKAALL